MSEEKKHSGNGFSILIVLSIIAILIFVFWDKIKPYILKPKLKNDNAVSETGNGSTSASITVDTILSKGMNNDFVILLQELLNVQLQKEGKKVTDIPGSGCNPDYLKDGMLIPDGDFGTCTETALAYLIGETSSSVSNLTKLFGLQVEGITVYEQVPNETYNPGGLQSFFNWLNMFD